MCLPQDMLEGASVAEEIGWRAEVFPNVLANARRHRLACLGGQYQFRFDDGICDMYWLNADSDERADGQSWTEFVAQSNDQVGARFKKLTESTDFDYEVQDWSFVRDRKLKGVDPMEHLWFVAYFVSEAEYEDLARESRSDA